MTIEYPVHFTRSRRGRKSLANDTQPTPVPSGRIPRISRLMALAIRFQDLIDRGEVRDYAELARLGHVTRARVTQIMNLLNLAPDIQETILHLGRIAEGKDPIVELHLRRIVAEINWFKQRLLWQNNTWG